MVAVGREIPNAVEPAMPATAPEPAPAPARAPTPSSPSSAELETLPRAGIQPAIDRVRRRLRAALTSAATWAGKAASSSKKLAANGVRFAHGIRARLRPSTTMGAWATRLGDKARASLPSVSALRLDNRPRWFLPVVAVAGLAVGIGLMAILVSALSKGSDETNAHDQNPGSQPSATASAAQASEPAPSAAPSVAEPAPVAGPSLTPCTVAGSPHVVAPRAIVAAGVEVVPLGDDVALGFAPVEKEAMAVRLDPASLTATVTARARSLDPVSRATPIVNAKGALSVVIDAEKKNDRLRGRRAVLTDPPIQLGAAEGSLEWAPLRQGPAGALWPLEGNDEVESVRGAVESNGEPAMAIAFRRAGAVWTGAATGAAPFAAKGDLARVEGLGPAIGSPAVAISGGVVLVAWADRPSTEEPWHLRWVRFRAGDPPGPPTTFVPPGGSTGEQTMSPGLTALSGGRFLLVWTEGPMSGHGVRAQTLSQEGAPLGAPLVVSTEGTNAGGGQAAVNAGGQGIVAFLESRGEAFEVAATSIECGR